MYPSISAASSGGTWTTRVLSDVVRAPSRLIPVDRMQRHRRERIVGSACGTATVATFSTVKFRVQHGDNRNRRSAVECRSRVGVRARAGGVSLTGRVRIHLAALVRQRVPIDSVVRALETDSDRSVRPEVDDDAIALVQIYGLPRRCTDCLGSKGVCCRSVAQRICAERACGIGPAAPRSKT